MAVEQEADYCRSIEGSGEHESRLAMDFLCGFGVGSGVVEGFHRFDIAGCGGDH